MGCVIHRLRGVLSRSWQCPHAGVMSSEISRECLRLIDRQGGVLAIGQALEAGMTAEWIRNQVRYGRWQVMHRGVYAAFTGRAPRGAALRRGHMAIQSRDPRRPPLFQPKLPSPNVVCI